MSVKDNINNHLLSFVWLMLFILPNNTMFYVFVPLAFCLLYRQKDNIKTTNISLLIIASLTVTTILFFSKDYVTSKDIIRAVVLILLFISFGRLKGDRILKPYIYIGITFLIISQFAGLFDIQFISNTIRTHYALDLDNVERALSRSEDFNIADFGVTRLGGIYFNPNQYARNLQIMYITMLCEARQFRKIELMIITPIIILSVFATGSRTSIIVMVLILIAQLYFTRKISIKKLAVIVAAGVIIISFALLNTDLLDLRALKIDEGMDDSFGIKMGLVSTYIDNTYNPLMLFMGTLSTGVLSSGYNMSHTGTDFDIGNILIMYGIFFYILFTVFCISIYKQIRPEYRVIFCILLWMFSSSIICSYRMAPIFLLILGLYYRQSLIQRNYERKNKKTLI